jgi:uncharacterized membrane protein
MLPEIHQPARIGVAMEQSRRAIRLPYILRVIRARPRLFLSTVCGVVIVLLLPRGLRDATRLLIGWDIGVAIYLVLAAIMMVHADIGRIKRRAALQDEGQFVILLLSAAAALASLAAILAELSGAGGTGHHPLNLALAAITIVLSWSFIHSIFALHYAHEFYDQRARRAPALIFPGNDEPDYWDFLYFSLVIGMTSQVSDVAIACKPIRRIVSLHGVISFFFNVALLALMVNMAASAI